MMPNSILYTLYVLRTAHLFVVNVNFVTTIRQPNIKTIFIYHRKWHRIVIKWTKQKVEIR